ncbi:MAG: hypothetical protein JRN62_02750 [Nitrososphaerota archaeon]|nr:hypothetical protein [Nitrososphaerota archaeon]MDG6948915.1 hypothetical protein [Nitrososphaerota archaeon]
MITVRLAKTEAEAEALAPMVRDAFKDEDLGIDAYKRWYLRNGKCLIVAYDDRKAPLGYIDYFPLTGTGDARLVTGGSEGDIVPETDFTTPGSMKTANVAYLAGIVVASHGSEAGKDVTAALMAGMAAHLKKYYGDRRVTLLGIAYSAEGGRIMRRMDGNVMVPGSQRKDGHDLYRVDLVPELRQYVFETAVRRLARDRVDVWMEI